MGHSNRSKNIFYLLCKLGNPFSIPIHTKDQNQQALIFINKIIPHCLAVHDQHLSYLLHPVFVSWPLALLILLLSGIERTKTPLFNL
jgi:hypothetical protein